MKKYLKLILVTLLYIIVCSGVISASHDIPANDPNIQYYGRWDFSNPLAPTHSWPAVYIYVEFEGTSIGIQTNDNACWYNVILDGNFLFVFHGVSSAVAPYTLVSGLPNGQHTLLFTKRGETSWTKFSFNGFILDDNKNLLPPPEKPSRKIEFIGDSYTSASGNEWIDNSVPPNDSYTNIYKGFGPIVARHYNAQYNMSSRAGAGLVLDWQGIYTNNVPLYFDRTLFYTPTPKWDFTQWVPNLVVICLGLNDYSGWGGYAGAIPQERADYYKQKYHDFIARIMDLYPGVNILAVAPNDLAWLKKQIYEVVSEENTMGHTNVHYTYFPYYNGEYVNSGHPNLSAHQKIADRLIAAIDTFDPWTPFVDTTPPSFVDLPVDPLTAVTNPYILNIKTDTYSKVRYSTEDKPYDQMENEFTTTGTRDHSVTVNVEQGKPYKYYLRAMDSYGNKMNTSGVINFSVDTTKTYINWKSPDYNHSQWKVGTAPFGNNNPEVVTTLPKAITAYFRKSINFPDASAVTDLRIWMKGFDGAVIYLNGKLISRINMNQGSDFSYDSYAIKADTLDNSIVLTNTNGLNYLKNGENIFAVEMHSRQVFPPMLTYYSMIYDINGNTYSDFVSDWYYSDEGKVPPVQLVDKVTGITEDNGVIPDKISLYPNYPNPFNPETIISFDLSKKEHAELDVFNMLGEKIATLVDKELEAGKYSFKFDAKNLASGIYFYRLKTENYNKVQKMTFLK